MQRRAASGGRGWLVVLLVSVAILGGLAVGAIGDAGGSAAGSPEEPGASAPEVLQADALPAEAGPLPTGADLLPVDADGISADSGLSDDGRLSAATESSRRSLVWSATSAAGARTASATTPVSGAAAPTSGAITAAPGTIASASGSATSASSTARTAHSGPTSTGSSAAQAGDSIVEYAEYDLLPSEPDTVEAEIRYEIPDDVSALSFAITGGGYSVEDTDGFETTNTGRFEWDESTEGPTVTVRHDVDESFRPEREDDQYVGGTDEWAIVTRPQTSTRWNWSWNNPGLEYQLGTVDDGHAGTRFAFLGSHEVRSRTVDGERISVVVPDAADPASDPSEILDSIAYASDRLRFGNRNDEVVTIVAPTGEIGWGPPGLTIGADSRVSADARVEDRINVWVHEYVHTRQYRDAEVPNGDAVADDAHWAIEGSADYYAALMSLEQGKISFPAFRAVLDRGSDSSVSDAVLVDRSSWANSDAEYLKGALVVGAIDREIREASNGEATFQAVMEDWNEAETFTAEDIEASAAEHGDESVREFVRTYTRTDAVPASWDRSTHDELFDRELPRFDYRAVGDPTLSVSGPFRSGSLPEPLVVGENVSATLRVENVGNVTGSYRASLVVGERDRAVATGSLAPREAETVTLTQRVPRAGNVRIVAGDVSRTVRVREPATPGATQLGVRPRFPTAGDDVDVTVSVTNPTSRPADGNVTVHSNGEAVAIEGVQLAPGENATVELSTSFDEPGQYTVSVGELSVEVTVQEEEDVLERIPLLLLAGGALALLATLGSALLLVRRL